MTFAPQLRSLLFIPAWLSLAAATQQPTDRYFPDSPPNVQEFPYNGRLTKPVGNGFSVVLLESTQQVIATKALSSGGGSFLLPKPMKPLHKSTGPFRLCLTKANKRYCGSAGTATPTISLPNGVKTQIERNVQ